jgi:transposase-like protein
MAELLNPISNLSARIETNCSACASSNVTLIKEHSNCNHYRCMNCGHDFQIYFQKPQNLTEKADDVMLIKRSVIIEILKLVDEGFTLKKRLKRKLHELVRS